MRRENLYEPNCIRTFSGKYINVFDPNPDDIVIEDIAHALSNIPRFGGHLPKFYSVAQHSIKCAEYINFDFKLEALMHDASEAYLLDVPKPIKEGLPDYIRVEENLQKVICEKFGLTFPMSKEVKAVDKTMLEYEWVNLMLGEGEPLKVFSHKYAKQRFLQMFKVLSGNV